MVRCSRCREEKSTAEFYRHPTRANGLSSYCKSCQLSHNREWRAKNAERKRAGDLRRRQEARRKIDAIKTAHACADCGERFPPYAMDFDHLGDKKLAISAMHDHSWAQVEAEIAKCELVCANCHKIRTHRRRKIKIGAAETWNEYHRRKMAKFKETIACADCKKHYPAAATEWDHLPGHEKYADVARLYMCRWETIMAEVAKCELVCTNCHRGRTVSRMKQPPTLT